MNDIKRMIKSLICRKNIGGLNISYCKNAKIRLNERHIYNKTAKRIVETILLELEIKNNINISIRDYKTFDYGKNFSVNIYNNDENDKYMFTLGFYYEDYFCQIPSIRVINETQKTTNEYEMSRNKAKEGITLSQISYEKIFPDGTECYIYYETDIASIIITKGTNKFKLHMAKINPPMAVKDEYGITKKYTINNEEKLIEYLSNLEFPISIDEVYKEICKISLGYIKEYEHITIEASLENKITDLIHILSGEWEKFTRTKNGKTVTIERNGCWSYELDNIPKEINLSDEQSKEIPVKFSMNYDISTGVSYKVNTKTEDQITEYVNLIATSDISLAESEIEETKKFVRELIKK